MASDAFVELSKDEAIEHLRRAAWAPDIATCGHTGCEEHQGPSEQKMIHSRLNGLGADHRLEFAEQIIRTADVVGWAPRILYGHERSPRAVFEHQLYARTPDGREYYYDDVRKPNPEPGDVS